VASLSTTWEIAQVLGLCAVASCLILCILAVRPRAGAASAFSVRGHELLGWLALATAVLHVGLLLGVDNRVAEHVKLTAPRYEYAGILALFTLLFLTVPGGAAWISRLKPGEGWNSALTVRLRRLPLQELAATTLILLVEREGLEPSTPAL